MVYEDEAITYLNWERKNNRQMIIDKEFYSVEHPENNFLKYGNVESDLLFGKKPESPVFLTIVIITYKRPEMIKRAIQSVCNQKKVHYTWEIVIMDNDPDNQKLYDYIEGLHNDRIRYYRNRINLGHEGNVNRGIELASGKWVGLLHDDDLLTPDYLVLIEQYIKACSGWSYPLAYIRAKHLMFTQESELPEYKDKRTIEKNFFIKRELWIESLLRGCGPTYVNSCGSLVNRKAFMEIGGYNEKLNPIGDATLGLIFMKHGYSIYATEQVLGFYRQGKNISLEKETLLSLIEADFYLREYLYSKNAITRLFGKIFREAQYSEAVDGKIGDAVKYQEDSFKEIPSAEEINNIHPYKKCKISRQILRKTRRCLELFYRQSHLIERK